MPASYTIRRSVPRNTRRSKPASTPSTCFPSFSINLFMAFPLPRGDLSSNTTNIIREQETPSPFGCGYAALCYLNVRFVRLRRGYLPDVVGSRAVRSEVDPAAVAGPTRPSAVRRLCRQLLGRAAFGAHYPDVIISGGQRVEHDFLAV